MIPLGIPAPAEIAGITTDQPLSPKDDKMNKDADWRNLFN